MQPPQYIVQCNELVIICTVERREASEKPMKPAKLLCGESQMVESACSGFYSVSSICKKDNCAVTGESKSLF